jgi:hypothetical protein
MSKSDDDRDTYWNQAGYKPLSPRGRAYEQWALKLSGLDNEDVGYEPEELCPCCRGEDPPPSGVRRRFKVPPAPASAPRLVKPQKRKPKP